MKSGNKFDEKAILRVLIELESGRSTQEKICRKYGISESTLSDWKSEYAGLESSFESLTKTSGTSRVDTYLIVLVLLAVFGGLFLRDRLNPGLEHVVTGSLGVVVGIVILWWLYREAAGGRAGFNRLQVSRHERPIFFWFLISLWTVSGLAFTIAAAWYALGI